VTWSGARDQTACSGGPNRRPERLETRNGLRRDRCRLLAVFTGATEPLHATVFKIDPTVMSAPLIATLVDATGLIIYFTIAKHLLGL